ncbi:DNA repair exonuclease [Deltaproteobacteria bacterium TL4]
MAFTFIHAADLHLDSPFCGVTADSPNIAEALRSATFEAYDALIDLCIERQVQFLLIAGDIYDGVDRSLRAQLYFHDGLKRLADHQIQAFIVHGNHDPFKGHSRTIEWPGGVHIFDYGKVESVPVLVNQTQIAVISGISHEKRNEKNNLVKKFDKMDSDTFQIGLLHCNVGGEMGHEPYAPCDLEELLEVGMNYWALGHVHEKKVLHENPYVVYSGNTQGRSIREQNERGCFLVHVDDTQHVTDLEFCELDTVRWVSGLVPLDGILTLDQLDKALCRGMENLVNKQSRPCLCRLTLTGCTSLYQELHKEGSLEGLLQRTREAFNSNTPFVWLQKLSLDCRPEIDLEKRRESHDFLGQVLRIGAELAETEESLKRLFEEGLGELYHNNRASKVLQEIAPEEIVQMLKDAELLCLYMLETDQ